MLWPNYRSSLPHIFDRPSFRPFKKEKVKDLPLCPAGLPRVRIPKCLPAYMQYYLRRSTWLYTCTTSIRPQRLTTECHVFLRGHESTALCGCTKPQQGRAISFAGYACRSRNETTTFPSQCRPKVRTNSDTIGNSEVWYTILPGV